MCSMSGEALIVVLFVGVMVRGAWVPNYHETTVI